VVVKALNVRLQGEPADELRQMLIEGVEREAAALRECEHENIVRLFDSGASLDHAGREFYYLVLEYVAGGSLKDLLQHRRLKLQESLSLLGQVKDALSCLHQRGLMHRDIKPSNVMLLKDRRVAKLIDLGTIRWLDDPGQITEIGTPAYAAPEHYTLTRIQNKSLTVAADVYAFAKTSYRVLTGSEPTDFRQRQITSLPQLVQAESWSMPVLRVLMKATSDDPAERHQSIAEFFTDLSDATEVTTYRAQASDEGESVPQPGKSRFVVNVTSFSKQPARITFVLDQLTTLFAFVRLVTWNLSLRFVDRCLSLSGVAGRVPARLYALVAGVVLFGVGILFFGPGILQVTRQLLVQRAAIVEPKRDQPKEILKSTTDVNIRELPDRKAKRVGLIERDSTVRVLGKNQTQKWCEIETVAHGRPKVDPGVDHGWVSCQYLIP
jgi:hypothetical protein